MNYERMVRRLRVHAFDDRLPEKDKQFERILYRAVGKKIKTYPEPKVGPYSGLTRSELAATNTCEPDWY